MSSSRGAAGMGVDMTAAAERKKKRARSVRKRKIDEVSDSSAALPPIIEVDETSASRTSQEEPNSTPAPEIQDELGGDAVRAPGPKQPAVDNLVWRDIPVKVLESDSAVNDPRVARRIMEAVTLPSDVLEIEKMPYPIILDQYFGCVAQTNTIFQLTRKMLEETKAQRLEAEKREAASEAQRLEAEKREAALEAKFQAFMKESTKEYQLLQDELVRVNGLLSKSEEEARLGKEALKMSQARCRHAEERQDELKRDLEKARDVAILEYKKSDEFGDLIGDVVLPAFFDGFEDCQEKAREKYPQMDLSSLVPKYGTREEVLGDGGEEGDEAGEEELQEKPQGDPGLQKGKAAAVETEEMGGPSSQDQPPAFAENPDFADV